MPEERTERLLKRLQGFCEVSMQASNTSGLQSLIKKLQEGLSAEEQFPVFASQIVVASRYGRSSHGEQLDCSSFSCSWQLMNNCHMVRDSQFLASTYAHTLDFNLTSVQKVDYCSVRKLHQLHLRDCIMSQKSNPTVQQSGCLSLSRVMPNKFDLWFSFGFPGLELQRYVIAGSRGSSAGDTNYLSQGLTALHQPFKLNLSRASHETTLADYGSNTVLIEPLATMNAVEDFLYPRIQRSAEQARNERGSNPPAEAQPSPRAAAAAKAVSSLLPSAL